MKLTPGRFLGAPVKTRMLGGFVFTEYLYSERAVFARHCHEMAYFSLVLSGSYEEHYSKTQVRQCDSQRVLYHPAGEAHSDAFGNQGGKIFSIELESGWTAKLRDYELQTAESLVFPDRQVAWLARRAYQAFACTDPRSALLLEATAMELLYHFRGSMRNCLSLIHLVG